MALIYTLEEGKQAAEARRNGVFDDPQLLKLGPLGNIHSDLLRIWKSTDTSDVLVAILNHTKDLLDEDHAWCKHEAAKDINGHSVPFDNSEAVCFCLSGAISRSMKDLQAEDYIDIFLPVFKAINEGVHVETGIIAFNDDAKTTFEDVQKVIDRAIEIAAKKD